MIFALMVLAGLLSDQLAPYPYHRLSIDALSSPPTWSHPFGTNQVGRDYFSDVLHGLGTEIRIVLLVAFFGTTIGMLIGAIAGYFGGALDNVLMRLTDLLLIMPPLAGQHLRLTRAATSRRLPSTAPRRRGCRPRRPSADRCDVTKT